jgi:protein involved in sex pheromone biosynthesis
MMSHHQQERENTMKKHLIIIFAICVLFLSACGSLVGTSTPSSNPASHSTAPVATASAQSVCQILHDRLVLLNQEYQAASAQLVAAQAVGNLQQVGEAEKTLMRLHQSIPQVQAQLKAC